MRGREGRPCRRQASIDDALPEAAIESYSASVHPLEHLGYGPFFSTQLELLDGAPDLVPARIAADWGSRYELLGCQAKVGELSGTLRRATQALARPATGDWVAVSDGPECAVIHHVLDRKTLLTRRAAGTGGGFLVVAANVDVFFVVTSANRDLNPRRIERYLAAVWDSGATPVVVLNKCDLAEDLPSLISSIEAVAPSVAVVAVSAHTGEGMDALSPHLARDTTVAFIGSSGVGKSSLINRLFGQPAEQVGEARSDGKGRHTTTRRQLSVLPSGVLVIDTPGMRELGVADAELGLDAAFPEIAALAERCRFGDCQHESEPGCAVRDAAARGDLGAERLESYRKLRRETAAADARSSPALAANTKRRWKVIHKRMRAFSKSDRKRR